MKYTMKSLTNYIITVITVTKNRPQLLQRAIKSVKNQKLAGILHYIVIDDCKDTLNMLENTFFDDPSVVWDYCDNRTMLAAGPQRLSVLRNDAIHRTETDYFCFLDDDNEFYPDHLEQLLKFAMIEQCDAVHSYREILYQDGTPYLEKLSPWGHTIEQRREKYKELVENGIATPGSNIWHDKYGITVDTNVWLFRTSLMKKIGIPVEYTEYDYDNVIPEDAKMMRAMQKYNIVVKSNHKVSVKYYLGGYSNGCGNTEGTVEWEY